MSRYRKLFILLMFPLLLFFVSCKKDKQPDAPTSPRVGTSWTYTYKTFNASGTLSTTSSIRYRAISEETLAGEKWLKLVDSVNNPVFLLRVRANGLNQYANNAAQLLCKDPASVNDAYTSYNEGSDEDFTVTHVNLQLDLPYFNAIVTRYTGQRAGQTDDILWYNKNLWLAKMEKYVLNTFTGVRHIDKRWELTEIRY
ncbi:MAG: hypothetical protein HYZ15_07125 [Sphingobacteriales bacterium]|nr:hypothetical protein [Sphingobacteriales bacterium]